MHPVALIRPTNGRIDRIAFQDIRSVQPHRSPIIHEFIPKGDIQVVRFGQVIIALYRLAADHPVDGQAQVGLRREDEGIPYHPHRPQNIPIERDIVKIGILISLPHADKHEMGLPPFGDLHRNGCLKTDLFGIVEVAV